MTKKKCSAYEQMRISFNKEQSEMIKKLSEHFDEPGTNIIKKCLERFYSTLQFKD